MEKNKGSSGSIEHEHLQYHLFFGGEKKHLSNFFGPLFDGDFPEETSCMFTNASMLPALGQAFEQLRSLRRSGNPEMIDVSMFPKISKIFLVLPHHIYMVSILNM